MNKESGYFYLNRDNPWPDCKDHLHDVEVAQKYKHAPDGSLILSREGYKYKRRGVFRSGPLEVHASPTPWFRLRVYTDPLPEGAHLQLFTCTGETGEPLYNHQAVDPFPAPDWQAAPRDVLDVLILNPPARYLWVGGMLWSTGRETPVIHQMRVDYGRDTYLKYLPAIYRQDDRPRDFLEQFLAFFESELGGLEAVIHDLPRLFDPLAAPQGDNFPSWLSWLAGWLGFDLSEAWSEADTRRFLVQAFQLYGRRGTIPGLRGYLKMYAGVEAHIYEPALHTHLWSLGEVSQLGFTTMLAPAHLAGAVLDATAILDRTHLADREDRGAALLEDLAHHFCVGVYCSELTRSGALADVRLVIEREKPAHTTYDLCVIEPRMRVGVQARLGIDAIIAAGPPPAHVGMMLDLGILAPAENPANQ